MLPSDSDDSAGGAEHQPNLGNPNPTISCGETKPLVDIPQGSPQADQTLSIVDDGHQNYGIKLVGNCFVASISNFRGVRIKCFGRNRQTKSALYLDLSEPEIHPSDAMITPNTRLPVIEKLKSLEPTESIRALSPQINHHIGPWTEAVPEDFLKHDRPRHCPYPNATENPPRPATSRINSKPEVAENSPASRTTSLLPKVTVVAIPVGDLGEVSSPDHVARVPKFDNSLTVNSFGPVLTHKASPDYPDFSIQEIHNSSLRYGVSERIPPSSSSSASTVKPHLENDFVVASRINRLATAISAWLPADTLDFGIAMADLTRPATCAGQTLVSTGYPLVASDTQRAPVLSTLEAVIGTPTLKSARLFSTSFWYRPTAHPDWGATNDTVNEVSIENKPRASTGNRLIKCIVVQYYYWRLWGPE